MVSMFIFVGPYEKGPFRDNLVLLGGILKETSTHLRVCGNCFVL